MYEEQSAIMLLQLLIQGMTVTLKVTGAIGIKGVKIMGMAVYHALTKDNKEIGKTNVKQLIARGGDIQILQIDEADKKEFQRLAKKYGILYCELPDLNKGDGKMEVMFHSESMPRMNALMQHLNSAKIISQSDYVNNAESKEVEKLSGEVEKGLKENPDAVKFQSSGRAQAISPRIEYQSGPEISRLEQSKWFDLKRFQAYMENPAYQRCVIKKEDVYQEMQDHYLVRVPYSRDNAYIKVSKEKMWLIHDAYHTFFKKDDMVLQYRKDGKEIRSKPFDEFYQDHYDPVVTAILQENYYKTAYNDYDGMGKERLPIKEERKGDLKEEKVRKADSRNIQRNISSNMTNSGIIRFSMDEVLLDHVDQTRNELFFRVPKSNGNYYISVPVNKLTMAENQTTRDGQERIRTTYFMQYKEDEMLTVFDNNRQGEFQISAKALYHQYYDYDKKWKGKKEPEAIKEQNQKKSNFKALKPKTSKPKERTVK